MKQTTSSLAVMAAGILFGMFVPGKYNGHSMSTIGWVIAAVAALSALVSIGFAVRQQNTDKKIASSMLGSNKTRVFMGDNRDHFHSDDMIEK